MRAMALERLVHGEVSGVLLVAQRVDDQRIDAGDQRPRSSGIPLQSVR